jgi:phosphoribosylaminoimidazole-succinocarboxamide synthase
MTASETSRIVAEGKTKILYEVPGSDDLLRMVAKDAISAGDGARMVSLPDKGRLCAQVNENVFTLLNACRIPTAYRQSIGPAEDLVLRCAMLPYEVVAVREITAASSAPKRDPGLMVGQVLSVLHVYFFLKTNGLDFKGVAVPKADPWMTNYAVHYITVRHPHRPVGGIPEQNPGVEIPGELVYEGGRLHPFRSMEDLVRQVFHILEYACMPCGLCDLKIEFGLRSDGQLVVADVITPDEIRLLNRKGQHKDKQLFRDGRPNEEVIEAYREVAAYSDGFPGLSVAARAYMERRFAWENDRLDHANSPTLNRTF